MGKFPKREGCAHQQKARLPSKAPVRPLKAVAHADFLSLLGRAKAKRDRERLLALADAGQIDAVIECIENVNENIVPVPKEKIQKLRRHSKHVHALLKPRVSLQRKKSLLNKTGGFLRSILPMVTAAIAHLAHK